MDPSIQHLDTFLGDTVAEVKMPIATRKNKVAPKTYTRFAAGGVVLFGPGVRVLAFRPNEGSIQKPGEAESNGLITIYKTFDTHGTKYEAISYELIALRQRLVWNTNMAVLWETENDNVQLRGKAKLRIVGWNAKSIAYANREIDRILTGYPVIHGSQPVWHWFFSTEDGLAYLKGTCCQHNVHVHRSTSKRKLYLFGSHEARNICQTIFFHMVQVLNKGTLEPESKHEIEGDCIICLGKADKPVETSCGHVYCRDCFAHQCAHVEQKDVPVRCLSCAKVFSLAELQSVLNYDQFEDLLARALRFFINAQFKTFHYCPTPNCPQVYDASGGILTCPTCFADICLQCHVLYHAGETCTAYRERTEGGQAAFVEWKEEHNAKDCPKCGIVIEKIAGCNHVKCGRCKAEFCWVCLEVFRLETEVYAHMQRVHGGFVDRPEAELEARLYEVVEGWADMLPDFQLQDDEDDQDSESGEDLDDMQPHDQENGVALPREDEA